MDAWERPMGWRRDEDNVLFWPWPRRTVPCARQRLMKVAGFLESIDRVRSPRVIPRAVRLGLESGISCSGGNAGEGGLERHGTPRLILTLCHGCDHVTAPVGTPALQKGATLRPAGAARGARWRGGSWRGSWCATAQRPTRRARSLR